MVWIASYPRSGNNLFLTTLQRVYGMAHASIYRGESNAPFVKTHNLADRHEMDPGVYIVRDGRDSLVSYAHWVRWHGRVPPEWSYEESLRMLIERKRPPTGSWSSNVRSWRTRKAPTALVHYENLIEDSPVAVRRAVESLGVALPEPQARMPTFEEMHRRRPDIARRGKVGAWEDEMPPELHELFWELHGEEMRAMGYPQAD